MQEGVFLILNLSLELHTLIVGSCIFFFNQDSISLHYKIHGLTTNYKLRATNKISASIVVVQSCGFEKPKSFDICTSMQA